MTRRRPSMHDSTWTNEPLINVFQPSLGKEELAAVERVFLSNWIGRGPETDLFESEFAAHLGVPRNCIRSVSCCTEGLFQALSLLRVGDGDEVVLPTISFVGAGNAVASSGARPVFCDVDGRTLNATASTIEAALTARTRAVILLHYGGVPARMEEIAPLLERREIRLIEDSACSVASRLGGRPCGTFGDLGVWSFDAMKHISTGDGGMIHCRDTAQTEALRQSLNLGLVDESGLGSQKPRWWEFEISSFGRRAIMNDVASAVGRTQLRKLGAFVDARRRVHEGYNRALEGEEWLTLPPAIPADASSSYYFYWVQTEPKMRDRLAAHLRGRGVYTTFRYHPLHRVGRYRYEGSLPVAERAAERTLLLPLHQALSASDVDRVISAVREFGEGL